MKMKGLLNNIQISNALIYSTQKSKIYIHEGRKMGADFQLR